MKSDEIVLGYRFADDETGRAGQPVSVNRELLKDGHMHVRGRTRSGKTSLSIVPLLMQLLKPYTLYDEEGRVVEENVRDAVFVFDMGGDLPLFHTLRNECRDPSSPRTFRFLSLDDREDWDYFDPFQVVPAGENHIIRLSNLFVQAFHLDYGLIYGGSYYTSRNLAALDRIATQLVREYQQETASFGLEEIAAYLSQHREKDEDQIRMTFQFLLHYAQLQRAPAGLDKNIDMATALEKGEVVYFLTPTLGEATTARQIAGLGLYTLINAAMLRGRNGLPQRHAWVVVDEFQELASRSFAALLAQSSKFAVSLIMSNQTTTQLETRDINLAEIVADNTIIKQYFTCISDDDINGLQTLSKEESHWLSRTSHSLDGKSSLGEQEFLLPKLRKETIQDVSAAHRQSFLVIDDGTGHKEPLPLVHNYAIAAANYRRFKRLPPPRLEAPRQETKPGAGSPPEPLWKRARAGEASKARQALLQPLWEAQQAAERVAAAA